MKKHVLTPREQKFITEAKNGYFGWALDYNGRPYALGANDTGNLFSMPVIETPDIRPRESTYTVDYDYEDDEPSPNGRGER